jgi:hypothetical protein
VRRGLLLILIGLGGGWIALGDGAAVLAEWRARPGWAYAEGLVSSWWKSLGTPAEPVSASMATTAAAARIEPLVPPPVLETPPQIIIPPAASAAVPAAPVKPEEPEAAAGAQEQPTTPLPPPVAPPGDPYRKRAEAVGLHPDLSRVLLDRLSPADYRNAAHAVETALAKTPNTGVFVWPRQRRPEEALFKVHFVQGAAPGCRRYVVAITKDGWLTTALPMERCGFPQTRRSARRE